MAQMKWTYVADSGEQYRVVLFHGRRTGHVLVTVNQKVSIVDFFVRDSKSYQIMLEDELFLLELEKGESGFGYAFAIDQFADTVKNRARNIDRKRQALWVILGAVVFFGSAVLIMMWMKGYQEELTRNKNLPLLAEIGVVTIGRISIEGPNSWVLHFSAGPEVYHIKLDTVKSGLAQVKTGDDFGVVFLQGNPKVNQINWDKPGPERSNRLLMEWARGGLRSIVDIPCLVEHVAENESIMCNPRAPWQIEAGGSVSTWLSDQDEAFQTQISERCTIQDSDPAE